MASWAHILVESRFIKISGRNVNSQMERTENLYSPGGGGQIILVTLCMGKACDAYL